MISTRTTAPVAKLDVVLAIGSREQIEFLKMSRGFTSVTRSLPEERPPPVHTNIDLPTHNSQSILEQKLSSSARPNVLGDMLNQFIDNLASRIPDRPTAPPCPVPNAQPVRRTSDLLDTLQRALQAAPPVPAAKFFPDTLVAPIKKNIPIEAPSNFDDHFRVKIEIENALHIGKVRAKTANKAVNKSRGGRNKHRNSSGGAIAEIEPSTYVTFQAKGAVDGVLSTPDGPVYATHLIPNSCSPQWNKVFEVWLPVDLLTNVS